jgi:hypothetical protein
MTKEFDNAAESTAVYNILVQKHNQAVIKLDELQTLQRQVDAQVEDYNRIVLSLGRALSALKPAMKLVEDDDTEFQREMAASVMQEVENEAS